MAFSYVAITSLGILTAVGLSLVFVLIGIIVFICVWLKRSTIYFPRGKYIEEASDSESDDRIKMFSSSHYFSFLFKILNDFDSTYWIRYVGFEGSLGS